jgi:phosphoglycerate dehydrogenase-like enzyme
MNYIHCLNNISTKGTNLLPDEYQLTDDVDQATGILVRSAKMHDMEFSDNLLAIARAGAGVNNIPLDRCAQEGIVVFNAPGANANAVKEITIAALLLGSRGIVEGINWTRDNADDPDIAKKAEKAKKQFAGREVLGKKLGVIGLGAIGAKVANAAVDLGMDVYGYDPYVSVKAAWNISSAVHHITDLVELCGTCDYLTIHVPAMDSTKGMINAEAIAAMQPGTVFLNFSRDTLEHHRPRHRRDAGQPEQPIDDEKHGHDASARPHDQTAGEQSGVVPPNTRHHQERHRRVASHGPDEQRARRKQPRTPLGGKTNAQEGRCRRQRGDFTREPPYARRGCIQIGVGQRTCKSKPGDAQDAGGGMRRGDSRKAERLPFVFSHSPLLRRNYTRCGTFFCNEAVTWEFPRSHPGWVDGAQDAKRTRRRKMPPPGRVQTSPALVMWRTDEALGARPFGHPL